MLKFGHPKVAVVPLLGILFLKRWLAGRHGSDWRSPYQHQLQSPAGNLRSDPRSRCTADRVLPRRAVRLGIQRARIPDSWHGVRRRAVPLLKPIVAVAGDRVVLSAEGMRVNGRLLPKTAPLFRDAAGRSLHPWPFGAYVVEGGSGLGGLHLQSRQLRLPLHGTDQHLPDPREAPPIMASLIWFRVVAAGAIGLIAWRGQLWAIPLSIVVPCLIAVQPTRSAAGATSFAYYAAASLPVIAVAKAYWPSSEAGAVFMWLAAAGTSVRALGSLLDATGVASAVDRGHRGGAHRRAAALHHRLGVAVAVRRCAVSEFGLARHCRRFGTPWFVDSQEDPVDHAASRRRGQPLPERSGEASAGHQPAGKAR